MNKPSSPEATARTVPRIGAQDQGPVLLANRITALDTIRGVATLGILGMNALSFGLAPAAYMNVSADGIAWPIDSAVGAATMVFVDQKMMALFSLLFGVGVVMFADRARAKGRRVIWLSLWRFALLAGIGMAHTALWDGDVLVLYAACAPIVLLVSRLPATALLILGIIVAQAGSVAALLVQVEVNDDLEMLGDLWFTDAGEMSDTVLGWFIINGAGRALGLMLIGVAFFRTGLVQAERSAAFYRRLARWGLALGIPITGLGMILRFASGWAPDHALTGSIPTGIGTIPMAVGYLSLIILWNRKGGSLIERFRSVGRMALTNYLTQTVLGVMMLTWMWNAQVQSRSLIIVWMIGVWALQMWWSRWWLERFHFGPVEWLWRCATYRRWQALSRK